MPRFTRHVGSNLWAAVLDIAKQATKIDSVRLNPSFTITGMDTLRIGLLGLGQRGLQHLNALWKLQANGLCQVVALGDKFVDNLEQAKIQSFVDGFALQGVTESPIQTSTNFTTLLDAELDALYICLPPNVHNGEVIAAAQAGIHLFVEKPMSLSLSEALAMERAIAKAGVLSCVGFQQRFDVRHEAVHQYLHDKEAVMATYTMHAPFEGHNVKHTHTEEEGGPTNRVWTANKAWSGMTVVEGGIHPLDLWRYWFGDVVWVQATYNHRPDAAVQDGWDNPYAYSALFGFENGVVGNMRLSRLRKVFAAHSEHQVLCTESRLDLDGRDLVEYAYRGDYPPTEQPTPAQTRRLIDLSAPRDTTLEIARAFVTAVAQNDPSLIRSPFSDAMNSLAAVLGANVSDERNGERVVIADLLETQ